MNYQLKIWPSYFEALKSGEKKHEVRQGLDRPYQTADEIEFWEWDPETEDYTGRKLKAIVTWVSRGEFGIPNDVYVLSIEVIGKEKV